MPKLMSARPSMQGESDEDDDIVVTPEAIEAAQGIVMSPDSVGTRRSRSIVRQRRQQTSPQVSEAIKRAAKKAVAKMRRGAATTAPFAEDDFTLTPGSMPVDEGEGDTVLSGMAGENAGLGKTSKKVKKELVALRAEVAAYKAGQVPGMPALTAQQYPQQYAPAEQYAPQYQPQYQPQYAPAQPSYFEVADGDAVAAPEYESSDVVSLDEMDRGVGSFFSSVHRRVTSPLKTAAKRVTSAKKSLTSPQTILTGAAGEGGATSSAKPRQQDSKVAKFTALATKRREVATAKVEAQFAAGEAKKQAIIQARTNSLLQMAEAAGYPANDVPTLLQGRGYKRAIKTLNSLAKIKANADVKLYKDSVQAIAAGGELPLSAQAVADAYPDALIPVQPMYPDVSAAPAYPQAMFAPGQTYPDNYPSAAMMNREPAAPDYDSSVMPMSRVDRETLSESEIVTSVPYGNAGGEDFDVDVAPSLPGGEYAEPRRVYPSGALSTRQFQSESQGDSMISDDIDIPVGMAGDKFMDDPMRDGFMRASMAPSRTSYDTIGGAGMPKGVTPEVENTYEQDSADQIDDMARPAQLAEGNFAGEPYSAGESMIPFGRSFRGKRMDILDSSVVGLTRDRLSGRLTISPVGMDENLLVDGAAISMELSGEEASDFVTLGQLPTFGALGMSAIENTMMTLRLRESALMSISPAGYEAAIMPYAPLRDKLNLDYEAMKADNTKVNAMGLSWGMSAATYKSVLDRAINAARGAVQAAAPRPRVVTQIKEVVREVPAAVKQTLFSKYGLVVAIGGAVVLGGLFFLRSRQKKS